MPEFDAQAAKAFKPLRWVESTGEPPGGVYTDGIMVRLRDGTEAHVEPGDMADLSWEMHSRDDAIVAYAYPIERAPMPPPDTDALMAQLAAYLAAPVVDVTAHARVVVVVREVLDAWLAEVGHG